MLHDDEHVAALVERLHEEKRDLSNLKVFAQHGRNMYWYVSRHGPYGWMFDHKLVEAVDGLPLYNNQRGVFCITPLGRAVQQRLHLLRETARCFTN